MFLFITLNQHLRIWFVVFKKVLSSLKYEIIFVNDGSYDKSWDIIKKLADRFDSIRGFNLMRNYGQGNAILCGINKAKYDVIITMDDDLQHPPEAIWKLLKKFDEGYDVVYATPEKSCQSPGRELLSTITRSTFQKIIGIGFARQISSFRVFHSKLKNVIDSYHGIFVSIDAILPWGTDRISSVPIQFEPRRLGSSNYTVKKLIEVAFNIITGFTFFPLRLILVTGFLFLLSGLIIFLFLFLTDLFQRGNVVWSGPIIIPVISIFSGIQLLSIGIVADYLGRIYFVTINRPPFVVRSSTEEKRERHLLE